MPDASGTLETIALELGKALQPLEDLLGEGPGIFTKLGEELPREIAGDANIANKLSTAGTTDGSFDKVTPRHATRTAERNTHQTIDTAVAHDMHLGQQYLDRR